VTSDTGAHRAQISAENLAPHVSCKWSRQDALLVLIATTAARVSRRFRSGFRLSRPSECAPTIVTADERRVDVVDVSAAIPARVVSKRAARAAYLQESAARLTTARNPSP
jgi:hypothetical protein